MKRFMLGIVTIICAWTLRADSFSCPQRAIPLYDFADSVTTIQSLIQTNSLGSLLPPEQHHLANALIVNVSPSEIAFHADIISSELPIILYFYSPTDTSHGNLSNLLYSFASRHDQDVICFMVNADEFFKIAEIMAVESTPLFSVVNNKKELDRLIDFNDHDAVMQWLEDQINSAYLIKSW